MGLLLKIIFASPLAFPALAEAADIPGILSSEITKMERRGYSVSQEASAHLKHLELRMLVFSNPERGDNLNIYRLERGVFRLIYMDPRASIKISLASIHEGGDIPDLLGDRSRILAYTVTMPGLNNQVLNILRYAHEEIKPVGNPLLFGRFEDIDGSGKLKIISRYRPLGQFFSLQCEYFHAMAMTAFRTTVYDWRGSKLIPVSSSHVPYFESHIAQLEETLKTDDPRSSGNYGDYLGNALSLYFDFAEIGRAQEGWRHFMRFFPMEGVPGKVKTCLLEMEATLRKQLRIPDDW